MGPWGCGQATEHGGRELLELRAAPGSSNTIRGDQESISLPEQPGWSLDDSEAHRSRERALGGVPRRSCLYRGHASRNRELSRRVARPHEKERLERLGP
ncbi:hypothetical protein NDU88_003918 [Pleurodeles waltl]|uniref:Uncharacterized protein n=1 Tax=Pleurodeles waltl TaxID=8319 RepID=A0AAV7MW01_PLEWA|nr:hypothetical protein NDU88_003918 [Pleurodeles waltl]